MCVLSCYMLKMHQLKILKYKNKSLSNRISDIQSHRYVTIRPNQLKHAWLL